MRLTIHKLLVFIVLFISCTDRLAQSALDRVEQNLASQPEIALQEVRALDASELKTRKDRARYSLLLVRALDKNGIDTTDISILKPAIEYFSSTGVPREKAYVLYYLGTIQCNAGDYYSAVMSLMDALEEAEKTDDDWIKGMICTLLGISFNQNHLNKEELEYQQKAFDYFCHQGDSSYLCNSAYHLAVAYHNNRDFDRADSLLSRIDKDNSIYPSALLQLGFNEITRPDGDPERAVSYFMKAHSKGKRFSNVHCLQYAFALYKAGYHNDSKRLYDSITTNKSDAAVNWWDYMLSKESGDYPSAIVHLESFTQNSDSLICAKLSQSLYKAGAEHFLRKKEKAEKDAQTSKLILILVATLLVILVLIIFIVYQRHLLQIREEKALLEQQLSSSQQMLEIAQNNFENEEKQRDDVLRQLRCSFAILYQKSFNDIGKLYGRNLELSFMVDKGVEQYKNKVSAILKELSDDKRRQAMFEARVNKDLDNILVKIKEDFPGFGPETIRFLSYVIVGFDSITISSILDEQSSASRMRKSRLRKQILEADTPNHELYKAFLE